MKKNLSFFMIFTLISGWYLTSFAQETRIVGGKDVTDPSKYPWIAALVDSIEIEQDISYGQFCGGTLITPQWVVTAAHCVCDSPNDVIAVKDIDVVLGMVDLKANPNTYERIGVTRIIVHPDYNPDITDNDVALLKLQKPSHQPAVDFMATPETDPSASTNPSSADNRVMSTVMGWGDTESQRSSYPNQLQEVNLPLLSSHECAAFFGEGEITDNMLCAGFAEGGKDSCFGDSGGPLVVPHNDKGYILTGIVSWGNGCGQPSSYGVYTRVSKIHEWILEQIKLTDAPVVLTDSTPTTVYSWNNISIYGCDGINNLTIQSGARAKLINFPGINLINIQALSSLFSVSRSGAMVTFKDNSNGTTVIMSATTNIQLIVFYNLTTILEVKGNKVMLGKQEVTKAEEKVSPF